ncbi:MAG: hypothetical protein V4481_02105 [Patescibacteria group bacterium]
MKYFEIVLKILFVAGAVTFFLDRNTFWDSICYFLAVCLVLGITLIFNKKKQSYGYKLAKREIVMRRVEGIVLVVFAVVFAILKAQSMI